MKKSTHFLIAIATIVCAISACKKDNVNPNFDRYIVGSSVFKTPQGNYTSNAALWINDSIIRLSDNQYSRAVAICIDHDDVYILGNLFINGEFSACYWKNGVLKVLPPFTSRILPNEIAVKNGDINISFNTYNQFNSTYTAYIWHNGVVVPLQNGSNAQVTGISINDVDGAVYISGRKEINVGIDAVYWKNGQYFRLGPGQTSDIVTFNNDIYIVGTVASPLTGYATVVYWKNSFINYITQNYTSYGSNISVTDYGLTVLGSSLFYSTNGIISNRDCYWKGNIVRNLLPVPSNDEERNKVVLDFVGYNNYVYSVGTIFDSLLQAYYWENTRPYKLPSGCTDCYSRAEAIAIKVK